MKTKQPMQRSGASPEAASLPGYQLSTLRPGRTGTTEDGSTVSHRRSARGFTLVEMIIIIGIIALLAAMLFPVAGAVKNARLRKTAQARLAKMEIAIEAYKTKMGHYPPDNATSDALRFEHNPLYYELLGTKVISGGAYQTLDGRVQITSADATSALGVGGFVNCTRGGGGDEGRPGVQFLKDLKTEEFIVVSGTPVYSLLGAPVEGPVVFDDGSGRKMNPWRYNSSSPTNNPNSYDLWIDIKIGDKTYRISNWSKTATIVP